MPYTTNPHINSTGRSLLTDDLLEETTKHRTGRTDRTGRGTAARKAQINYRDPVINLYTFGRTPQDNSTQKFNRETFLTTDGRRAGRNNDEIPHRPTNSMETGRRYCNDLEINLYSAFLARHDDSTWKFNREIFSDGGLLQDKPILITATL